MQRVSTSRPNSSVPNQRAADRCREPVRDVHLHGGLSHVAPTAAPNMISRVNRLLATSRSSTNRRSGNSAARPSVLG